MTDIFGQDIKLDDELEAVVAANGELVLTEGAETAAQDVRLRIMTPLESLFYDVSFGSLVHHWFREENTQGNRMAFEAELSRRVKADSRVALGTVSCKVQSWDEKGITASLSWRLSEEDSLLNLVVFVDSEKMELVVKDVELG